MLKVSKYITTSLHTVDLPHFVDAHRDSNNICLRLQTKHQLTP